MVNVEVCKTLNGGSSPPLAFLNFSGRNKVYMKKSIKTKEYLTKVVNTDGSTFDIKFPYSKKLIFLQTDYLTSNDLFSENKIVNQTRKQINFKELFKKK